MSLNETASAERVHIGFFGRRNAGKSSLVNAVTGQNLALVSDIKGTTTDPVKKAMELLPLGPVVIVDTPGMDDEGVLGKMRVNRAKQTLNYMDIAVLVVDAADGLQEDDHVLMQMFEEKRIPYLIAWNKADLLENEQEPFNSLENKGTQSAHDKNTPLFKEPETPPSLLVSAVTGSGIHELKEQIAALAKRTETGKVLVRDLVTEGDAVVLVTPIDASAPKGRLILPQQQTIRDLLDGGAIPVVTKDTELTKALSLLNGQPRLVITDSQAFGKVSKLVPENLLLTSFSILFARYKGNLTEAVRGAAMLNQLKDGDTVLISEGCTHHRQCGDIGTGKLPAWIKHYTGKELHFAFTSGTEFPEDLSAFALVIHCGGCMLNEREMQYRIRHAVDCGVPITNYGIAIAMVHGILRRSLEPFPDVLQLLDE